MADEDFLRVARETVTKLQREVDVWNRLIEILSAPAQPPVEPNPGEEQPPADPPPPVVDPVPQPDPSPVPDPDPVPTPDPADPRRMLSGFAAKNDKPAPGRLPNDTFGHLLQLESELRPSNPCTTLLFMPGVWTPRNLTPGYNFPADLAQRCTERGVTLIVRLPIMFREQITTFDQVIAGESYPVMDRFFQYLKENGQGRCIVSAGWELELNRSFPGAYGFDFDKTAPNSPSNFRKAKAARLKVMERIRQKLPDALIDVCHFKAPIIRDMPGGGDYIIPLEKLQLPRDAYDICSVDWYDYDHMKPDQVEEQMKKKRGGNPWGLDAWFDYARSSGHLFAVPEWGVNYDNPAPGADNPLFIRTMYERFKSYAPHFVAEAYFRPDKAVHSLREGTAARREYQRLYRRA